MNAAILIFVFSVLLFIYFPFLSAFQDNSIPVHNGFGSDADSIQTCKGCVVRYFLLLSCFLSCPFLLCSILSFAIVYCTLLLYFTLYLYPNLCVCLSVSLSLSLSVCLSFFLLLSLSLFYSSLSIPLSLSILSFPSPLLSDLYSLNLYVKMRQK